MKQIIVCRSAEWEADGSMTVSSSHKMGNVTNFGSRPAGPNTCLFSSTESGARKTLEFMAKELEITDIGFDEVLGTTDPVNHRHPWTSLVESKSQYDVVILVTHVDITSFLNEYAHRSMNAVLIPPVGHGEAMVISFENFRTRIYYK